MTPEELSRIHAASFVLSRSWRATEFDALLANPYNHLFTFQDGFALVQVIAGEAELLTIAVDPPMQGQGIGHILMRQWMSTVQADTAFLEVAEDNHCARHLYTRHGFHETSRRSAYYLRGNGPAVDAIMMRASL